eukprot:CAMPEP_0197876092 /NCGR_PEP_ID=MMETSP1439-20131203/5166_1 /TAXON_ID=66791 /ORGANISM="Gonyaulax spinifera, Strain CCMP409" /LENGTH=101 /DNA_ID=CAMNT_0043495361 /DNA_START=71 /DNA_END=373 /DNA_ORIENTATION=+
MAARRPVLCALALAAVGAWLVHAALVPSAPQQEVFVATSPALRGLQQGSGAFAGSRAAPAVSVVAAQALPEPRPNDAMLPVDLNRTSLYWGLLCILVLSVL